MLLMLAVIMDCRKRKEFCSIPSCINSLWKFSLWNGWMLSEIWNKSCRFSSIDKLATVDNFELTVGCAVSTSAIITLRFHISWIHIVSARHFSFSYFYVSSSWVFFKSFHSFGKFGNVKSLSVCSVPYLSVTCHFPAICGERGEGR